MKKKLFKRLLVLAVSAAMVFGTCGTSLAAGGTDTVAAAEDETVSAAATLEQDSDGYYLITSGDDMDAFAQIVLTDTDANARLTKDITLNEGYVPIGTESLSTSSTASSTYAYAGTFDGQGHTISGLSISGDYYYVGLFAHVTSGSVIKDFTVEGSVTGLGYLSGVAARAVGTVTIQDVVSNVNLISTSGNYVGGILAYSSSSSEVDILACENNGDIISSSGNYMGGIAGYLAGPADVIGCRNTGDIEAKSYASGIVAYDYKTTTQTQIIGCANTGDITATSTGYVGGILSYGYGIVQYCFNTGKITTSGTTKSNSGGIVGYIYGSSTSLMGLVDSCFNAGSFDNSTGYFGGIVGNGGASYAYQSITNCYNTADVGSSAVARAGGIVYSTYYATPIENCYNIGTITASTCAGEIVGYYSSTTAKFTKAANCYYLSSSSNGACGSGNTVSGASSVDSDTLKDYAETLGDAYKTDSNSINDGYPILTYQDLTVSEVKALMEALDETASTYLTDLGYAYAAYYCLSDEDQAKVFGATVDTLTVTKTVSEIDTNGYALTSDLTSSISGTSYTFTLYKADDPNGTNAAAVSAVSYVLTDADGNETECVTGTDGSFTLKDGETATFGGEYTATLGSAIDMDTAGYYYVTESDTATNYETSWTQSTAVSDAVVADATGRTSSYVPVTGGADNIDEVNFDCTNTYVQDVVSVTKTVSDQYVSATLYEELNDNTYTFTLYKTTDGTKSAAAGLSYTVYEDGTAGSTLTTGDDGSFTLTGGQTACFIGVDLDSAVTYSVEEAALTDIWTTAWTAASSVSDASIGENGDSVTVTGSSSTADTIDFTCTNTYLADSVTVTKTVSDTSASGAALSDSMKSYLGIQSFSFTLYASGTAVANESYSVYEGETLVSTDNVTGTDGTFTLSSGQTASFESLDMSGEVSYSVTENDLDDSLWTTSWSAVSSASTEAVTSSTTSSGSVSLTGAVTTADVIDFTCTNTYAYDSFLIYTLDDLAEFSEIVSAGYNPDATVMADIDATGTTSDGSSFEPIGGSLENTDATAYPEAYSGTFDGNGYTITLAMENSGCYYTGLFGSLGEGGVIQNLTVAGTVTGDIGTGAVAAYATGGTIENVTSNVTVTGGGKNTGGFVGQSTSTALVIKNCVNNGSVSTGGVQCGGFLGYGYATISSCTNNGAISSSTYAVGGIVGTFSSGSSVTNSLNYGTVTGTYNVAGIVGNCSGTVQYCGNNGAVTTTGTSTSNYGGGVVGYLSASGASVNSCYNKAAVSGTNRVGGVVGIINGSTSYTTSVTNCYNTGSVSSSSGYAGGVAAQLFYKSELKNCYNTGDLSTTATSAYLGGVVARMSATNAPEATSNNYALNTADSAVAYNYSNVTEDMMKLVDSDTLKTYATATTDEDGNTTESVLGSAYKEDTVSINSGYPILLWEYHTYEASWTWAEDYSTATLILTCTDGDDEQTVEATVTSEVTTAATCTEEGLQTYTATATYNDVEYTDTQTETIAATGHTYGLPSFTWADDCSSVTATFTCSVCGDVQTVTVTDITSETTAATCTETGLITYTATVTFEDTEHTATTSVVLAATGHDYDNGVVTTEATCTEDGVLTYTCKNDSSHTYTEAIPATGHSYSLTGFTWSDDYSATATFTCANDAAHTETVEATVTSEVTTEATCTAEGVRTYTATVTFNGTDYTDTSTGTIEKIAHSYEAVVTDPTCTEGGYTTYTCSVCGDTYTADATEATGHSYEAVVTEPTCTEGGYTTYTCSVCGDTYTADETEATGHSYGSDGYCTVCGDYSAEAAAAAVIELIEAIGDVTTDSSDAITAARAAYDALLASDPDAAALVTNVDTLTEAEETYTALTTEDTAGGGGTTGESSYAVPSTKIAAEKVSLTGATVAQVTKTLAKLTNDGDLKDSTYYLLQAKAKKTSKKSVKLSWKKVDGAASYVVYANACGKSKKLKKYKVTSKTSLNITKVAGKKLSSGKYYKFLVIALDADGKVIQTSKVIHAATKGGSVTNAKSLTLYKSGKKVTSLTLKKGKSAKITAKVTKQNKKKKIQNHRKTKYESSNKKIATVTANGKIKAKAKGTCYIYAYAQNGVCKKIKVTVK